MSEKEQATHPVEKSLGKEDVASRRKKLQRYVLLYRWTPWLQIGSLAAIAALLLSLQGELSGPSTAIVGWAIGVPVAVLVAVQIWKHQPRSGSLVERDPVAEYRTELGRQLATVRQANRVIPLMLALYAFRIAQYYHEVSTGHGGSQSLLVFYVAIFILVAIIAVRQRFVAKRIGREIQDLH